MRHVVLLEMIDRHFRQGELISSYRFIFTGDELTAAHMSGR